MVRTNASPKRPTPARILTYLCSVLVLVALIVAIAFICAWLLCPFPTNRLLQWPASPLVLDVKGRPMLSIVSPDEQRRYPVSLDDISPWLIQATIAVEDERFYSHFGVDPWAVLRAAGQNVAARRIVSGASTLDMQICRMMDQRPRTYRAKVTESFRALQLDHLMSKDKVIELYLNIAPYGGNLQGVEAASLAYFDRHARDLSLPEAALIAGLPQSPSRYRPDKNLAPALKRQHVVLHRMFKEGMITRKQLQEAQSSPIEICEPSRAVRAPHASWLALKRRAAGGRTTINLDIQGQAEKLAWDHLAQLPDNTEVAVVIIDVADSAIIAMVGSGDPNDPVDGQVNGAMAKRSPGSALKPFIYAAAFEMGRLNSESIVHDVPISRGGWTPENFDGTFSEQISVAEALRRSLNVPAVLVAEAVGLPGCCGILEAAGIRLPSDAQRRGGLALAVGGIEVTLLDLTNAYATLARRGIRTSPRLLVDESSNPAQVLKPQVCASISDILSSRHRHPKGMEQLLPEAIPWFMWKTGTSSGRRDAWAVGHNCRYAIGVWIGRFRGTGRSCYVGVGAAEPLLARLFALPQLRNDTDPPSCTPITVQRPLSLPREVAEPLRITRPNVGEEFVALHDGKADIHAAANQQAGVLWFLNGKLVDPANDVRLFLPPGNYELLCVDSEGRSSSVTFTVCPGL